MRHRALSLLAVLLLLISACDGDDDAASPDDDVSDNDQADDDAADDDAADDDQTDDDVVDDDTVDDDDAVDDDAIDDDAIDDDTADDDAFTDAVCENPLGFLSGDPCVSGLSRLYCLNRTPLIIAGDQLSQTEATFGCQEGSAQIWYDLRECLAGGYILAQCLAERGYAADYTDIFDVEDWNPDVDWTFIQRYQALNLFYYHVNDQTIVDRWELTGGIVIPSGPLIRLSEEYIHSAFMDYINVYAIGTAGLISPQQINFALGGVWIWYDMVGGWDVQLYTDVLSFFPSQ